jgi:hypothetical protein
VLIQNGTTEQPNSLNSGAGILNEGRLELANSTVTQNTVAGNVGCACGGGIETRGEAELRKVAITSNHADANFGGGLAIVAGKLTVVRSTIAANSSGDGAGVGISGSDESVKLLRTTINHNEALAGSSGKGGGLWVASFGDSSLRATNVTITGNKADTDGGGIYLFNGGLKLNAATITDNIADYDEDDSGDGGGISGSSASYKNSIVAANIDLDTGNEDCSSPTGLGHNVVGIGTGCFPGTHSATVADPLLKPLGFYGGPTQTLALKGGSAAIGLAGGSAPDKDQRGVARDADPDAGSYER